MGLSKSLLRVLSLCGLHVAPYYSEGVRIMPSTRPSDTGKDKSQWWKDESGPELKGEIPEGPTANNKDASGKNKFDEEMEPVKHPASG